MNQIVVSDEIVDILREITPSRYLMTLKFDLYMKNLTVLIRIEKLFCP